MQLNVARSNLLLHGAGMANLAEKITELRGARTYVEFAVFTGVNRQTIRDVEAGAPIRLDTLRQIAKASGVTEGQWVDLLILWIRSAVGEDEFSKLNIGPAFKEGASGSDTASLLIRLFGGASLTHQNLILEALSAPPIMECVGSVARLFKCSNAASQGHDDSIPMKRVAANADNLLPPGRTAANAAARKVEAQEPAKRLHKK